MKVLTLWQPWATLMAIEAKRIETRSWGTKYRGPLAIHAAKTTKYLVNELLFKSPFYEALTGEGFNMKENDFPFGSIIAIVDLVACCRVTGAYLPICPEFSFGDYRLGRYMWMTENARQLREPVPWKGRQGLFEVPDDVLRKEND